MSLQVSGSYIEKLFWDNLFREFEARQLLLVSLEKRQSGFADSADRVATESRQHTYDIRVSS